MDNEKALTVKLDEAGVRFDAFLTKKLNVSRRVARELLDRGAIRFNGHVAKLADKGLILREGSTVNVTYSQEADATVVSEPQLALRILAEGRGWIAVDKPAGMAIHPLRPGETGTLLNAVAARFPSIQGVGERGLRSGVVHRLDLDTSGVVLFATEQTAWEKLRQAFASHQAVKIYRAIVWGHLRGEAHETMKLIMSQHKPARVKAYAMNENAPPEARVCDLSWRALEYLGSATLLEIRLGTGFLHQIRVMMSQLGYPIAGDLTYGKDNEPLTPGRHALHAAHVNAADATADSPDPADFAEFLGRLRAKPGGLPEDVR